MNLQPLQSNLKVLQEQQTQLHFNMETPLHLVNSEGPFRAGSVPNRNLNTVKYIVKYIVFQPDVMPGLPEAVSGAHYLIRAGGREEVSRPAW